jgi:murein DD-endopeptidase MepM/ murein hydrolase activator NlpD
MAWAGNNFSSPDQIKDGELIFVPEGVPPALAIPEPTAVPVAVEAPAPAPAPAPVPAPPPPAASAPTSNGGVSWPYSCGISQPFGGGHNGIDIDGICNNGAAIGAATSGTVISAVTSTFNGYGHYVEIESPDGIRTLYAHLSSVYVSIGQQVSQGQSLGIIGATGNSTGIHLHFEVRINGSLVNPLNYLP